MSSGDSWERLAHTLVAEHLMAHVGCCHFGPDGTPCRDANCPDCRADALYQRYVDKCQDAGHLHIATSLAGDYLYSVSEIMEHAREQTRSRREFGKQLRSI